MQVFANDFVYAVKTNLETLKPGEHMTASQLTARLGLDESLKPVVVALVAAQLPDYEAVKAKGYRRRKTIVVDPSECAGLEPAAE